LKLSERLETIIQMAPKSNCIADIGTDHGFVPIRFVQDGICKRAVASDVGKGPIERAKAHIEEAKLTDIIDVRLGDGLSTLQENECDTIVIAGMGGPLMETILSERPEILHTTKYFLLSPHTEPERIRFFMAENNFEIVQESMVFEDGKYYVMMLFKNGTNHKLSKEEILFGPILLKEKPEVFVCFLKNEERILKEIITKLEEKSNEKALQEKKKELELIQSVLSNVEN